MVYLAPVGSAETSQSSDCANEVTADNPQPFSPGKPTRGEARRAFNRGLKAIYRYQVGRPNVTWIDVERGKNWFVLVGVEANLETHCEALRELMANPEYVQMYRSELTREETEVVRQEAYELARKRRAMVSGSTYRGKPLLRLHGNARGTARKLHERFGDQIVIELGFHRFPRNKSKDGSSQSVCGEPLEVQPADPRFSVSMDLNEGNTIKRGLSGSGSFSATNLTEEVIRVGSGVPTPVIYTMSGEPVARWNGATILPYYIREVEPGESGGFGFSYYTYSCADGYGYVLPPGEYQVAVDFDVMIDEERVTATAAAPLTITPKK